MSDLAIHMFPCLSDNYGVLVHDPATGATAVVDAPDEAAIKKAVTETGWTPTHVWVTHHHWDHTQAIPALKDAYEATVVGPREEAGKIVDLDLKVGDGDSFDFGNGTVRVIGTPGHTLGQVAYWIPDAALAFTGDTLFAMGCGRVFEGTAEMMWLSLDRLAATLPAETRIYCGHEYTLANAKFAVTVDPDNAALAKRLEAVTALREAGKPTLPTTMAEERQTNPFLRARDESLRAHLGMTGAADWEVFAEVRKRKDHF
ncbi:MAG: hydroxyacylglutathione hydrolase [Hyphomicrobiales bacterium]|nr:hydroxyacylglutathione hydrolase [Hyphomicrobiales bacterium]